MYKKFQSTLVLLMLTIVTMAQTAKDNILPYPIFQKKLANGVNVVTIPYESPGIAAFYIVMRVGSRDEVEEGKSGFAHFFEHMMFRGTEKYPAHTYSEILKGTGASANANTSLDRTVYHMTGNAAMLDKMFEMEADRFMNLKYSVQQFKTEAGAVKGEYTKNYSSPFAQLDEKMSDVAFTKHTYKHTTMGFFKDVVDMPNQYDYSLEFFKRFYRPEYATILVVGDITPEKANALAEKYFGIWQKGNFVSNIAVEPEQMETRFAHIQVADFPPAINLSYKGPAFNDKEIDMPALNLMNAILFSEKSALYNKLVIKEHKVRSMNASAGLTRDPNLLDVNASLVAKEDMQYVKDEIVNAIEKIKTTPPSEKELAEAKTRIRYSFAMQIDNPTRIAEVASYYIWLTGDPQSINRNYVNYSKVTAKDVMAAAKKYYVPAHLTIGTISPDAASPIK